MRRWFGNFGISKKDIRAEMGKLINLGHPELQLSLNEKTRPLYPAQHTPMIEIAMQIGLCIRHASSGGERNPGYIVDQSIIFQTLWGSVIPGLEEHGGLPRVIFIGPSISTEPNSCLLVCSTNFSFHKKEAKPLQEFRRKMRCYRERAIEKDAAIPPLEQLGVRAVHPKYGVWRANCTYSGHQELEKNIKTASRPSCGFGNAFSLGTSNDGLPEPKAPCGGCAIKYRFSTSTRVGDDLNYYPYKCCAEDAFYARREGLNKQKKSILVSEKASMSLSIIRELSNSV